MNVKSFLVTGPALSELDAYFARVLKQGVVYHRNQGSILISERFAGFLSGQQASVIILMAPKADRNIQIDLIISGGNATLLQCDEEVILEELLKNIVDYCERKGWAIHDAISMSESLEGLAMEGPIDSIKGSMEKMAGTLAWENDLPKIVDAFQSGDPTDYAWAIHLLEQYRNRKHPEALKFIPPSNDELV